VAKLTLCMIVRDEEAMLPECLASARRAVDRMIVVDTGSSDGTRDVARRFGAEVVEHAWSDDFAAARNAGLERVDAGYVLVLDADERLTSRAARVLRDAARRGRVDVGLLPLHDAASADARPADVVAGRARRGEPILLPRLLRWSEDLRFEGVVHESIARYASRPGRRIEALDAPIVHYGAAPEVRAERGKDERNRALLERRCALEPENPIPLAHLAAELRRAGRTKEALEAARRAWACWEEARARGEQHDAVLPASVLAHLALRFDAFDEAMRVAEAALAIETHPNLHLLAGLVEERRALRHGAGADVLARAADHYAQCLALAGRRYASEVMEGATSWQAATRLGTVRLLGGEAGAACTAFEQALASRPDALEARLGRVEAMLEDDRAADALAAVEPMLAEACPDAWLLAAMIAARVGSREDARRLCDRARAERDRAPFVAPHRDRVITALERELGGELEPAGPPQAAAEGLCVFVWPRYDEPEDLDVLMRDYGKLLADRAGLVLCLRTDPAVDGEPAVVEAAIERAFGAHLGEACSLQVVLADQPLAHADDVARLAAPGDVAIVLPHTADARLRFVEALGVPRIDDPEALRAHLARDAGDVAGAAPDAQESPGPDPAARDRVSGVETSAATASTPAPSGTAATPATATVERVVAGRVVRVDYPDACGLRPFVEQVLDGTDYPIVGPGRFRPETIVDIGAHAGAATVYLKAHYPDAEVFAFEPARLAYGYLERNVAGLSGVSLRRAAIGAEAGEARLYAGRDSTMQSSLKPNEENGAASEPVEVLAAAEVFAALERERFSIVKLDTEGCEREILASLEPFLPAIEVIHLEYHSEADRLAIDRMLAPRFVLHAARADEPNRGTNTYVRADVLEALAGPEEERHVFPKA